MTELPATFGKYFLTEKLATGGMAQLYLAKLIGPGGFEKRLAIKQIHPELSGKSQFVQMFVAEAKTLVSLSHGNIVPVYELGVVDDTYFIAMEYIDGPTLAQLIEAYRKADAVLPPTVAAYVCAELLKGLDYAHRKGEGVVHRDLSPRNVLISRDGEVKLVDFGIAVALDNQALGGDGQPTGSFPYMSPEQVQQEALTAQSDLFSAGVLLWEMLTGTRLFARDTAEETLDAVMTANIPKPSSIRSSVPAAMDDICARALCRDREGRYTSAVQFLTALNRHLYSVESPVTPQRVSSLVARHCPPVVHHRPSSSFDGDDDDSATPAGSVTPVGDRTAVVERTTPLPARGKGARASTKTFATNVHFEDVLLKATPLFAFDAITDEPVLHPAANADAEATPRTTGRTSSPRPTPTHEPEPPEAPDAPAPSVTRAPSPDHAGDPTPTSGRNARTGAALLALVLVVGAVAAYTLTRGDSSRPAAPAIVVDAGIARDAPATRSTLPADASAPVDATTDAPGNTTRADARRRVRPRRADAGPVRPLATGTLKVGANPWGDVFVDGRRLGRAPGAWPLPVGPHKVVVSFPVAGREQKRTFHVRIDKGATQFVGIVDFSGGP